MPTSRTAMFAVVTLLLTCFIATRIYRLCGRKFDLMVSKRSLKNDNSTAPLTVNFPTNYHATGRLFLPHSNIVEPFEIWFTKDFNRSRIDYYYGTDKTFQRADLGKYGVTFKVVPMHTEEAGNYIGCWNLEGHKGWPIIPQPIVPNMSYFKYAGEEVYMGTPASRWEYRYMVYGLLNSHTLLVSKLDPIRPVRYEMKGYDSLMASYYDNYVVEYISFEEWKPDLEKFELPKDQWCYNWSHTMDSHFVSNPMGEFMSHGEDVVEEMYSIYKQQHGKIHSSKHEHVKRKHIFRHNMRYIRAINRQNLNYKLAPNHLVDLTDEEYDGHAGLSEDNGVKHEGGVHLEEHHEAYSNMSTVLKTIEVPDELDWRDYGAVTAVRGQGICGSCYALGAVGAVEGAYFMKTGRLLELSAQQIIDCSWGSGNHGCRGGWYNKALSWVYMNGVAEAKNYGPYLAQEGTCETLRIKERIKIDAFAFVPKYNNSALKRSIAKYGPACVSINQKPLSLKFYSWGVYDNPECDNSSTRHTVLVIGYGKEKGVPYWLVKNSWSSSWGIDGYIKLAWKDNICGVTKNPVVALFKDTSFQFPVKEKIDHVNPLDTDSFGRKVHAQHRPSFHVNVNRSRFHGNVKNSGVNVSAVEKSERTSRKKLESKIVSSNHLRGEGKEESTRNTLKMKKEAMKKQKIVISNNALRRKGLSQTASTTTSVMYAQKEEKSGDKTLIDRQTNKLETVTENGKSVKPVTSLKKHSKKADKDKHAKSKDDTVTIGSSNSQVKEFDYQDEGGNFDKTSHPLNSKSYSIKLHNKPENPVEMAEITEIPKGATYGGKSQPFVGYVHKGGTNLDMFDSRRINEIRADGNSFYSPEQAENIATEIVEPQYYYPLYDYNINNAYSLEYGGRERWKGKPPYQEYVNDLNQWVPANNLMSELGASRKYFLNSEVEIPLKHLTKMPEQLKVLHSDSRSAKVQWTSNSETTMKPATAKRITLKADSKGEKVTATKTVNNKHKKRTRPFRHYAGRLQDIYDKLERVIASSLVKKRPQRKNHVLKGY
ncbi:uncharacterized protein [Acropora muricata]|uniref:uncharacterized protein n=1 Tax=Acropora muricata TaxID=159855 RepID=UPI0034E5E9B0